MNFGKRVGVKRCLGSQDRNYTVLSGGRVEKRRSEDRVPAWRNVTEGRHGLTNDSGPTKDSRSHCDSETTLDEALRELHGTNRQRIVEGDYCSWRVSGRGQT